MMSRKSAVPYMNVDGATVDGGPAPAGIIAAGIGIVYCLVLGFLRVKAD